MRKNAQQSVTVAFALIAVLLAARHQWLQKLGAWAASEPKKVVNG